ncbi:lipid droplet surface protein [Nannochloropsis oceanica]
MSTLTGRQQANPQQAASVPKHNSMSTMGRIKIRLNRARNLKGPEILGMSNCLVVFTFEGKREESSVKVNDIAPAWHEEITFDNVLYPPSSKICITIVYRSGKKDEVLGVACPGSNLWTTGETPPQDRWLPVATKEGIYAGELNFHVHWTKTQVRYRQSVELLQRAVLKTQALTSPFEPSIERLVALFSDFLFFLGSRIKRLGNTQKGVVLALLVAVLAAVATCITVPALVFFPITALLVGGVLLGSVCALPLVMVGGWIVLCTRPVQQKVVGPVVERMLKMERVKKLLTLD